MRALQLTGKYSEGKFLLIDDEDFINVTQKQWHCTKNGYVVRNEGKKTILIHRFLMQAPNNLEVDHKDNDKLNNQKANLRRCTSQQNKFNSRKQKDNQSGFKGVYLKSDHPRTKPWEAKTYFNGKHIHLGYYATKEAAVQAHDSFVTAHHGIFAHHTPHVRL